MVALNAITIRGNINHPSQKSKDPGILQNSKESLGKKVKPKSKNIVWYVQKLSIIYVYILVRIA